MKKSRLAALSLAAFGVFGGTAATACSDETPCTVDTGEYYIALPDGAEGPVPALFWIHGFGGSGDGMMRNRGMVNPILERGYAVIAPSGIIPEGRRGGSWSFFPGISQRRDEIAFLTSVRDDAVARHGLDPDQILMAGFSIGGSMTAYLACAAPDTFKAYAPIGGNFWRPHPQGCESPVRMLHTHGWTDGTVPLEGRVLRGEDSNDPGALMQGDVFHALSIWRETNECFQLKADSFVTEGRFMRRKWERCAPDSALEFALHPGGHSIPRGWSAMILDWFEGL